MGRRDRLGPRRQQTITGSVPYCFEKTLGYTLIPVSRKDQNLSGINFLTIRPNRIMAIEGVSDEHKNREQHDWRIQDQ